MQAQRLNITLPYELARDFRRAVPEGKRSRFIAEAVKANREFYEKVAKEWSATEAETDSIKLLLM